MQSKRILFSPHEESNRFLVAGSTEIRLHQWRPSHASKNSLKTLASLSDLPSLRTLAWSPHAATDDLIAIGLATGRTLLVRLTDPAVNQPLSGAAYHSVSLNVRQQRPVNAITFSPAEPNLLAVALEKARDHAVHVWDVERSVRLLEAKLEGSTTDAIVEPQLSPVRARSIDQPRGQSPAPEARPFTLLASGEVANSVAFLNIGSGHSTQLAVGVGGKMIRSYDIREKLGTGSQSFSSSQSGTSYPERSTRAVLGMSADPFDGHRFVSHDDAGVIKLWDARFAADAVLTFCESDMPMSTAGTPERGASVRDAAGKKGGGLLGVQFCPSRRGVLASMEVNASTVQLWDIWRGAERWADPPSSLEDDFAFVPPILGSASRTIPFSRPPSSFAFANRSSTATSVALCSVSREGHIEFIRQRDPVQTAWSGQGEFTALNGRKVQLWSSQHNTSSATAAASHRGRAFPESLPQSLRPSFSRLSSALGERTPRPQPAKKHTSLQAEDIRTVVDRLAQLRDAEDEEDAPNAVASDISSVMKARVHLGYGTEASRNAKLTTEGLSEFWTWLARALRSLAGSRLLDMCTDADLMASKSRSLVEKFDFAYLGTLSILRGAPSILSRNKPQSHVDSSRSSTPVSFSISREAPSDASQAHEEVARALRRTANMSSAAADATRNEHAFTHATQHFIELNGVNAHVKVPSKKLLARRKLALAMCGPDFAVRTFLTLREWLLHVGQSDDSSAVARRAEEAGQLERATAWAVFSGDLEDAIHSLRTSKDERLKLLAPTLATYASRSSTDPAFGELYSSLSTDLDDAYLRSVFAYLADKSWLDVLDEQGLPLRDRLGIALRYLSDDELLRYLDSLAKSLIADGDLEGIAVTGLTGSGFQLLQNYVDRTCDIQTVALAVSFVHPGRINDPRAERWIATYRHLLDAWRLYVPRARFDVARGSRMRKTQEMLAAAGAPVETIDLAPTRLLIRCHYCNKTVAPNRNERQLEGKVDGTDSRPPSPMPENPRNRSNENRGQRMRTTNCPWCHKSFPRCSICLASLSVPEGTDDSEPPPAWCWCQRCRHGGHAAHLAEWFNKHAKCAVADCQCECTRLK